MSLLDSLDRLDELAAPFVGALASSLMVGIVGALLGTFYPDSYWLRFSSGCQPVKSDRCDCHHSRYDGLLSIVPQQVIVLMLDAQEAIRT
jgi:hypothetical protein